MTGSVIPRPLARARVKVVFPAPTSPTSSRQRGSCSDFRDRPKFSANEVKSSSDLKIMGLL